VDCRETADVVAREHGNVHRSEALNAASIVRLLERCDAFRKPRRFADILLACECDARGRLGLQDSPYPQRAHLLEALAAAQAVETQPLALAEQAAGRDGKQVGDAIRKARIKAVQDQLPATATGQTGQPPPCNT
jgi:tRNA nucleotidyltransferase (CCA-adding enzyme)